MDWIISDELGLTIGHLVGWGAAGAMIVGGVAPYIPQYRQIKRTQDAEGFSLYVCLALLIANTLRILFWFGKRYELPLLIQSIVMNVTMFVMIHLCVTVRKKNQIIRSRERIFTGAIFMLYILLCCVNGSDQPDETARWLDQRSGIATREKPHRFYDMDRKYFWAWTDFQSYLDCMLVFSVFGAAVTYLLIEFSPFVELIGFLAVFTEAMLGAPQIAKNHQNKSTEGMRFYNKFRMPGVLGCIDCTHVAIVRPVENEERYYCRKQYHSLNVQLICDADMNIISVDASYGGATHDSFIWNVHPLKPHLENLNEATWLLDSNGGVSGAVLTVIVDENARYKDTISVSMVVMWTCGDIFKTAYFVIREAPTQFWVCGSLQVTLDIVILFQVWLYRHNTAAARRVRRGD